MFEKFTYIYCQYISYQLLGECNTKESISNFNILAKNNNIGLCYVGTSIEIGTVYRYNVHVPFVHPLTSTRCFDPVTIDHGCLLLQLGGLIVTMGWTNCH